MPFEQGLVAAQRIVKAAGANRQPVSLAGAAMCVKFSGRRRALVVIKNTRFANHAKACVEIELIRVRVHDAVAGYTNEQGAIAGHTPMLAARRPLALCARG